MTRQAQDDWQLAGRQGKPLLAAGVHDALSARLAEEAGFDLLWISGLGVSVARRLVPDANIISMTEMIDVSRNAIEATSLPVLVDGDSGYGNAVNVIHAVRAYEGAGAVGLCLEDNEFPKRNSFYAKDGVGLVSVEEMCGKVKAAVDARASSNFKIIARTEALIVGKPPAQAAERLDLYAEAGADAVLMHGTKLRVVAEACRLRNKRVPLVLVPTKFPEATPEEFAEIGASVVIFANQALRAAVNAMQRSLSRLRRDQTSSNIESEISPIEELFRLSKVDEMREQERKYCNNPVNR